MDLYTFLNIFNKYFIAFYFSLGEGMNLNENKESLIDCYGSSSSAGISAF